MPLEVEAPGVLEGDLIIARDKGLISEEDIYAELGEIAGGQRPGLCWKKRRDWVWGPRWNSDAAQG